MAIFKSQRLFFLNQYERGADGKLKSIGAIGDGSGVSGLTGEIHQANGTVLNKQGQQIIDAHANTVNGMVKDQTGQWKTKTDLVSSGQMQSKASGTTSYGQKVGKTMNKNLVSNTQNAANIAKNNVSKGETLANAFAAGRNQGVKQATNTVGIKQGALNTWKNIGNSKFGTAKQAGIVGAGLLGAGLMAKGLFGGGSKEKQAAFSDDTNGALREAALLGTGLALTTGGVLAAKHGYLGKSAKNGYNKVSGKIKDIWHETNKFNNGPAKEGSNKAIKEGSKKTKKSLPGVTVVNESKTTVVKKKMKPETPSGSVVNKLPRYSQEDWKRIKDYCRNNNLDFRNRKDIEKAAAAVGARPL